MKTGKREEVGRANRGKEHKAVQASQFASGRSCLLAGNAVAVPIEVQPVARVTAV